MALWLRGGVWTLRWVMMVLSVMVGVVVLLRANHVLTAELPAPLRWVAAQILGHHAQIMGWSVPWLGGLVLGGFALAVFSPWPRSGREVQGMVDEPAEALSLPILPPRPKTFTGTGAIGVASVPHPADVRRERILRDVLQRSAPFVPPGGVQQSAADWHDDDDDDSSGPIGRHRRRVPAMAQG